MKTEHITYYTAEDGARFTSKSDCLNHEAKCAKVAEIMVALEIPSEAKSEIEAGRGWWQHDFNTVVKCRDAVLDLFATERMMEYYPVLRTRGPSLHPMSIIGRIIDDSDDEVIGPAWRRFCRIDQTGREFQQPYFALNGPDSYQKCLNQ